MRGGILVEPALEEAFQGPESGQYDDGQEPKNITWREEGGRRQKLLEIWMSVNLDSKYEEGGLAKRQLLVLKSSHSHSVPRTVRENDASGASYPMRAGIISLS
jgi:hypothetical protein